MIGPEIARARSAPLRRMPSISVLSLISRFISWPILPMVATDRSLSTCLKKENSLPSNSVSASCIGLSASAA
ncbi:hypothetical protein D3C83_193620 [compost metagenome]